MTRVINSISRIVNTLNNIAMIIASILLFALMILTTFDVLGRMLIRPILGTYELTYLGLALMVYLGLGYTHIQKGHVEIGVLTDKLPYRLQAILEALVYLATFLLLCLLSWRLFMYASSIPNNVTGDLYLPIDIFVVICACGAILFSLTVLVDCLKAVVKVVGKNGS